MKSAMRRCYYVVAYYLSWALFGVVGVALNLGCIPFLLLPARSQRGRKTRAVIRELFSWWLKWMHMTGVVRITWRGFEEPLTPGTIYIANHPTLVDAPFLLARLPDAICIFKPALMRNPAIGPAATLAGYASGDAGVDLIRDVAERVSAGRSLLIFPEGTRTPAGGAIGPLKPGFALIASRARAPVQLIVVRASSDIVPKGRPWWKPPDSHPSYFNFALDRRWEHDPGRSASELTAEVAARLQRVLETTPP